MKPRFDNLPAWLGWLETLHPKAIDLGLDRVRQVADRLGVRRAGVPVVTVAGTNGKGSTVALLEALLRAHGLRCGSYTSPHIRVFNERIRLDGVPIGDPALIDALAVIDAARDGISLSYFEFTTLAALVLFREASLDAWILEVGLGGRLDAVNVIDPDVAVLSSVGLDHLDWLGATRESIGREKAGIFRAYRPAVIGEPEPPASVAEAIATLPAQGFLLGRDFSSRTFPDASGWEWQGAGPDGARHRVSGLPLPSLPLVNAATAMQAFRLLPFGFRPEAVRDALGGVRLAGRNELRQVNGRKLVLDVGHNADALRFLRGELDRLERGDRFHVVLGMLADKDLAAAVRELEAIAASWHIAPLPSPRSASCDQLKTVIAAPVQACASIADALAAALASNDDLPVLVTGSFYSVAEAMRALDETPANR